MSYTGGIAFSVDNARNNQLFSSIDRAEMMEKIKADIMPMLYTGRIQANSAANYAHNPCAQLSNVYNVNSRDTSLLQGKGFRNDKIDASSRATQSASRFNYAFDRQINKRFIDVSGQFIPNNKLRVLPNRCCQMWGGGQVLPAPYEDPDLNQLSESLMAESINANLDYNPADANKYLKFKTTRPKLTRQDLMNSAQQYAKRPTAATAATNNATAAAITAAIAAVQPQVYSARTTQLLESARRRREAAAAGGLSIAIPV